MKVAIVELVSASPLGFSKFYSKEDVPLNDECRETPDKYEERTWRNRLHVQDGHAIIPSMAFKNCISAAAKFLSMQIRGKGKKTYTKSFEAGVMVPEPLILPDLAENVTGVWVHVPSDGVRGGSRRVMKKFPVIPKWNGTVSFYILDELITEEVFMKHIEAAGRFIGLLFWRPINNGMYGRFTVKSIKWQNGI
jgi:hypothetical protein